MGHASKMVRQKAGLGSGLESDKAIRKAIRAATYSKREQEGRSRLAADGDR